MRLRPTLLLLLVGLLFATGVHAYARNKWWQYEQEMQGPIDDPPDANRPAEFAFGRMRYRSSTDGRRMRWGIDANKGDRLFIVALKRLSLIDAQSIEQV